MCVVLANKEELIKASNIMMRKASDCYKAAQLTYANNLYDRCISDLNYACFQAFSALLILRGISYSKHAHVKATLNRDYAKTGVLPVSVVKDYNDLMDLRTEGDYSFVVEITEPVARYHLSTVVNFMKEVEELRLSEINKLK